MQQGKFDRDLFQRIKYRHVFKDTIYQPEHNHDLVRKVQQSVQREYGVLKKYLNKTIDKLDNRTVDKTVNVKELDKKYKLKANFSKVRFEKFKYCQIKHYSLNKKKAVKVGGEYYDLDDGGCFESEKSLDATTFMPYLDTEFTNLPNAFEKRVVKYTPKEDSNLLVSDNGWFYQRGKDDGSFPIDVQDIREVLKLTGNKKAIESLDETSHKFYTNHEINSDFFIQKPNKQSKLRKSILIFSDTNTEEDVTDYFFEDIQGQVFAKYKHDNNVFEVEIKSRNRLDNRLEILRKDNQPFDGELSSLTFKVNTLNLRRQKDAFNNIIKYPAKHNLPLLEIATDMQRLSNHPLKKVQRYKFLTDTDRQGTEEQRQFVRKALATTDFMLLEGPPGSGKTTAILELIYQIIKNNPKAKILLSASTHVAIDNVLERYMEFDKDDLNIDFFPIRLGFTGNIADSLDSISYETIKEKQGSDIADAYLRSANLVCGTTMGINRYLINRDLDDQAFVFDYLIIDEASKTTLQEFIVPASLSKRFVLTGDINQLAPFTDTFYLETLIKSMNSIDVHKQRALWLNFNLTKQNRRELYVIDSGRVLNHLKNMIDNNPDIAVINNSDDLPLIFSDKKRLAINEALFKQMKPFIPKKYTAVSKKRLSRTNNGDKSLVKYIDKEKERMEKAYKVLEADWEKEVAWRLVRHHELKKESHYKQDLDLLTADKQIRKELEEVADISIPSILMKLQEGISSSFNKFETIINKGFPKELKKSRFVKLKYQHRMHQEVAKYVTNIIYQNELKTSKNVIEERKTFPRLFNGSRNIFINNKTKEFSRNKNQNEVRLIIKVLKHMLDTLNKTDTKATIAILPFYRNQEKQIREELATFLREDYRIQNSRIRENRIDNVTIQLYTVDKFQGREADITINPLTRNKGIGFMNVPNRINVSMSRAKHYRVIVGDKDHFSKYKQYPFIPGLIEHSNVIEEGDIPNDFIK